MAGLLLASEVEGALVAGFANTMPPREQAFDSLASKLRLARHPFPVRCRPERDSADGLSVDLEGRNNTRFRMQKQHEMASSLLKFMGLATRRLGHMEVRVMPDFRNGLAVSSAFSSIKVVD
jgi:hypothetical protein